MIQLAPANEEAILFGMHQNLVGVWANASGDAASDSKTAVIMVTAGVIHHSGPFRLHVELAKQLSRQEVPSFRFDLSGIGESLAVGAAGTSLDRAADEIAQAIDLLSERFGIEKVILFGLCSGADDAIHAATIDARISGVIAMDGCGYRVPAFHLYRAKDHYLPRLFKFGKWVSVLQRRLGRSEETPQSLQFGDDIREFPTQEIAQSQLLKLAQRNTQLHFIYTGGVTDYYNHDSQFDAMFPELTDVPEISHHYFKDMDHVAFLCEDRWILTEHIVDQACQMLQAR